MNYLLDTCFLSEFTRRKPEERVVRWIEQWDEESLFLSVLTLGEIQHGVARLSESSRKSELLDWLNDGLIERFGQRILPLGAQTMRLWGLLTARMENEGRPMAIMDSLIAATALEHDLVIVTRNESDFLACGVSLINPWYQR